MHKEFLEQKDVLKGKSAASILDKYGGEEYLQSVPKELRVGQTENYVEYDRRGKVIKGIERAKAKSKYEEDGASSSLFFVPPPLWRRPPRDEQKLRPPAPRCCFFRLAQSIPATTSRCGARGTKSRPASGVTPAATRPSRVPTAVRVLFHPPFLMLRGICVRRLRFLTPEKFPCYRTFTAGQAGIEAAEAEASGANLLALPPATTSSSSSAGGGDSSKSLMQLKQERDDEERKKRKAAATTTDGEEEGGGGSGAKKSRTDRGNKDDGAAEKDFTGVTEKEMGEYCTSASLSRFRASWPARLASISVSLAFRRRVASLPPSPDNLYCCARTSSIARPS